MMASGETSVLRVLPRGRHAAPREVVAESQRERLLVAMADATAAKGYANVAVADVIERAGVSRRSFYEQFSNKEECFLAAYDAGVDGMLEEISEAEAAVAASAGGLLAGARAGTEVYLQLLADNPAFARTFLIEVLGAGPAALARRDAVHERFARRMAEAHAAMAAAVPSPRPTSSVPRSARSTSSSPSACSSRAPPRCPRCSTRSSRSSCACWAPRPGDSATKPSVVSPKRRRRSHAHTGTARS
jgi:AcrR family transcriptional regulator